MHCTRKAIELQDLSYSYPDATVGLDRLTTTIFHEERVALLGPNGAGKSTLIGHLNGILTPSSGQVCIESQPLNAANLRQIRERVGIVFQDPDNMLFMTQVADDVAFGPLNAGLSAGDARVRSEQALAAVGLSAQASRPGMHLSFGQKKRAALACVLSMQPAILVLDEPTSNLDPRARRDMIAFVRELDITLIVATHDLDLAWELCERTLVLDEGRIVADGSTRELMRDRALMLRHGLDVPPAALIPQ